MNFPLAGRYRKEAHGEEKSVRPSLACPAACIWCATLSGGKQVVGVEPLNVIATTQRKCFISGGRRPLIRLRHHPNFIRLKLPHDRQSPVSRTVIDDNDLFLGPGLAKRRGDSGADPVLGVVGRNQD